MYATEIEVQDYKGDRRLNCHVNAAWVTIRDDKTREELFRRDPSIPGWLDEKHRAVFDAVEQLEKAIIAATKKP